MFDSDIRYHLDSADECQAAGFSSRYNLEMSELFTEKQEFYKKFPSRLARRYARKEGIKVGRWY